MRVAFLTERDARDRRSWSGTVYYMAQALARIFPDLHYLGPVAPFERFFLKALDKTSQTLTSRRLAADHSPILAQGFNRVLKRRLSAQKFDVIVAPAASTLICSLETDVPIIYISDTTYQLLLGYHQHYSSLSEYSKTAGDDVERRAIHRAAAISYPSQWAADSAIQHYGCPPEKIHVIPFGANLDQVPDRETALAQAASPDKCRLLLVGVNWIRKGADMAVATLRKLREMGVPAELTVVGSTPPEPIEDPDLTVIPFLNKNEPEQRQELEQLYWDADFFLLPTQNDCYGIVFCEASAFGLPAIARDTGGVGGAVSNGVNGYLMPESATVEDYAQTIAEVYREPERYRALSQSSRNHFDQCLTWDAWATSIGELIKSVTPQSA